MEELLLGDCSWHFDSIMWHISKFGLMHKTNLIMEQHNEKTYHKKNNMKRHALPFGEHCRELWKYIVAAKIKTFMRFVWSLISYLKVGHFFIVHRNFIHVNGVVASFFPSPSILYFFSIMLSDVIHSRQVHREHILSKLVTAVVYNLFHFRNFGTSFNFFNHLIVSNYWVSWF